MEVATGEWLELRACLGPLEQIARVKSRPALRWLALFRILRAREERHITDRRAARVDVTLGDAIDRRARIG
jgi:hypothetical protein